MKPCIPHQKCKELCSREVFCYASIDVPVFDFEALILTFTSLYENEDLHMHIRINFHYHHLQRQSYILEASHISGWIRYYCS